MDRRREKLDRSDPFKRNRTVPSLHELADSMLESDAALDSALVVAEDGSIEGHNMRVTPLGIEFAGDVTEDEWLMLGTMIRRVRASFRWILADWAAYGDERGEWGATYEKMAAIAGLKEKTLREYAYVARNVPLSIRMDKLTLKHHHVVAGLPAEQQIIWLERALAGRWSANKLYAMVSNDSPTGESKTLHRLQKTIAQQNKFYNTIAKSLGRAGQQEQLAAVRLLDEQISHLQKLRKQFWKPNH